MARLLPVVALVAVSLLLVAPATELGARRGPRVLARELAALDLGDAARVPAEASCTGPVDDGTAESCVQLDPRRYGGDCDLVIQLLPMSPDIPIEEATVGVYTVSSEVHAWDSMSLCSNQSMPALRTYGVDLGDVLQISFCADKLFFSMPDGHALRPYEPVLTTVAAQQQVLAVNVGLLAFVDLDLGPRPPGGFPGLDMSIAGDGDECTWCGTWSRDPRKTARVAVRPAVPHTLLVHPHVVAGEMADPKEVWGLDGPIALPALAPGQTLRIAAPMHPLRGEVRGRVVTDEGLVPGAYVVWVGRVPDSQPLSYDIMALTDQDGCFVVRGVMQGMGRLQVVDSPALADYVLPETGDLHSQDGVVLDVGTIRLPRAGRIEGRCVGSVIRDDQYAYAWSPGAAEGWAAQLDADGTFHFPRLAEGRYAVRIGRLGDFPLLPQFRISIASPNREPEDARVDVRSGGTTSLEIAMSSVGR